MHKYLISLGQNWNNFLADQFVSLSLSLGFLVEASVQTKIDTMSNIQDFLEFLTDADPSFFLISTNIINSFEQEKLFLLKRPHKEIKGETKNLTSGHDRITSEKIHSSNYLSQDSLFINNNQSIQQKLIGNRLLAKNTIWIDPLTKYNKVKDLHKPFAHLYKSRFQQLNELLLHNRKNKPAAKKPKLLNDFEVNQRIFITGLIEDIKHVGSQLQHAKVLLHNFELNCRISALISLSQMPSGNLPIGVVIGITGKVTDISSQKQYQLISLTAESWIRPGVIPPVRKSIPKNINESWMAIVGNLSLLSQESQVAWKKVLNWLKKDHVDFRLRYIIFLGGLISDNPYFKRKLIKNVPMNILKKISIHEAYQKFYSDLTQISNSINLFVVPNCWDMTGSYLPQPPIHETYQGTNKNVHFISNPSFFQLEGQLLIFYNPYLYHSDLTDFYNRPDRFLIELLEFRHLAPYWNHTPRKLAPEILDHLVIKQIPDLFFCTHPFSTRIMKYKQIQIVTVPPLYNNLENVQKIKILLMNLHSKETREIKFIIPNN